MSHIRENVISVAVDKRGHDVVIAICGSHGGFEGKKRSAVAAEMLCECGALGILGERNRGGRGRGYLGMMNFNHFLRATSIPLNYYFVVSS